MNIHVNDIFINRELTSAILVTAAITESNEANKVMLTACYICFLDYKIHKTIIDAFLLLLLLILLLLFLDAHESYCNWTVCRIL